MQLIEKDDGRMVFYEPSFRVDERGILTFDSSDQARGLGVAEVIDSLVCPRCGSYVYLNLWLGNIAHAQRFGQFLKYAYGSRNIRGQLYPGGCIVHFIRHQNDHDCTMRLLTPEPKYDRHDPFYWAIAPTRKSVENVIGMFYANCISYMFSPYSSSQAKREIQELFEAAGLGLNTPYREDGRTVWDVLDPEKSVEFKRRICNSVMITEIIRGADSIFTLQRSETGCQAALFIDLAFVFELVQKFGDESVATLTASQILPPQPAEGTVITEGKMLSEKNRLVMRMVYSHLLNKLAPAEVNIAQAQGSEEVELDVSDVEFVEETEEPQQAEEINMDELEKRIDSFLSGVRLGGVTHG